MQGRLLEKRDSNYNTYFYKYDDNGNLTNKEVVESVEFGDLPYNKRIEELYEYTENGESLLREQGNKDSWNEFQYTL